MLLLLLVPAIGIETQGLAVTGLGLLAVLVGGYRLPEYLMFACISMFGRRARAEHAERWLRWLPPWWSEHLWLPLPDHAALLHGALEHNGSVAFEAVRRMCGLGQPGLQRTLLAALPSLVRAQLAQVQRPQEIAALNNAQTSSLAMLAGALITAGERLNIGRVRTASPTRIRLRPATQLPWERRRHQRVLPLAADVTLVLPGLCRVAQTVAEALAPPSDPRERAIARAQFDLRGGIPSEEMIAEYMQDVTPHPTLQDARSMLEHLAATLAADADAAQRWQPVIMHWRAVLQPA